MNPNDKFRVVSNFPRMSSVVDAMAYQLRNGITHIELISGGQRFSYSSILEKLRKNDALIINVDEPLLYRLCALRYLLPKKSCLLISVDILLRPPFTLRARLCCFLKGLFLKNVDYFFLYFKDTTGYQRYYGIKPEKCVYIPFKVNQLGLIRSHLATYPEPDDAFEGDKVMAIGRSLRDIDTFLHAMSRTGLPGAVLCQSQSVMESHGTRIREEAFPPNVTAIKHDGEDESFIKHIASARLVVIPRFYWDIKSTGISNYLMAMALGKCVIISHGPGASELLKGGEAILVPPEDPDALAMAIQTAWEQPEFRNKTARRGQQYALSLGDEDRLLKDILRLAYQCFMAK